jgi:hypothetical protein
VDLDTDSFVVKVDLVASSVLSSNDSVRHGCLALGIGVDIRLPSNLSGGLAGSVAPH